jgi:hypothetical protein
MRVIATSRLMFFVVFLLLAGAGLILHKNMKGKPIMNNVQHAPGSQASRPPIDLAVPSRVETATFAMG